MNKVMLFTGFTVLITLPDLPNCDPIFSPIKVPDLETPALEEFLFGEKFVKDCAGE